MSWPTQIESNEFGLCKLDPEKPLTLKVSVWSDVFGGGGAVTISGWDENGERYGHHFGAIGIAPSDTVVRDQKKHLQVLVDEFNENLADNWRTLVESAREHVLDYYKKRRREANRKIANAKKGIWS